FPDDERIGLVEAVAVFEAENARLGEGRVVHLEVARAEVRERREALATDRIEERRVAMRERSTARVLARDADALAFTDEGRECHRFAGAPIERRAVRDVLTAFVDDLLHLRVRVEVGGKLRELRGEVD